MKGTPLLQTICFVCIWLLLTPLVLSLTRSDSHQVKTQAESQINPTASPAGMRSVWITLRFAHVPATIEIHHGTSLLYHAKTPSSVFHEIETHLPMDSMAVSLSLSATWNQLDHQTATEMTLEPEGLESRSAHAWSGDTLQRTVRLSW